MAKKFITKEDKAAVLAAKAVLEKVAHRHRALEQVRKDADAEEPRTAEGGERWKAASEELYGLLGEMEDAGISLRLVGGGYEVSMSSRV